MMAITLDTQVTMLYYYRKDHIIHIQAHTQTHTGDTYDDNNLGYTSHHDYYYRKDHIIHIQAHTHRHRDSHW